jgi:hypothetical protein
LAQTLVAPAHAPRLTAGEEHPDDPWCPFGRCH